jgi:Flp pilus assembly pilin Flp
MRSLLRRGEDGERGAAAVEFALVLPVLVLLIFGIVEFGFAFRDTLSVASATRSGVRTASSLPRSPTFNDDTVAAVSRAVTTLPAGAIKELWVYRAGNNGYPFGHADFSSGCSSCTVWQWSDASRSFLPPTSTWDPATQDACADTAQSVGVFLKIDHHFITGMFGADMTLTDHTVMRFEPKPLFQRCR